MTSYTNFMTKYSQNDRLKRLKGFYPFSSSSIDMPDEFYVFDIIGSLRYVKYTCHLNASTRKVYIKPGIVPEIVKVKTSIVVAEDYNQARNTYGSNKVFVLTSILDTRHEDALKAFFCGNISQIKDFYFIELDDFSRESDINRILNLHGLSPQSTQAQQLQPTQVQPLQPTLQSTQPPRLTQPPQLSRPQPPRSFEALLRQATSKQSNPTDEFTLPNLNKGTISVQRPAVDIIRYTQSKVLQDRPLLQFFRDYNGTCKSPLDYISTGNMYLFLDCEYTSGDNTKIREISVICAVMGTTFLEPVASIQCREKSAVATCSQFLLTFPKFIEELKTQYNVGSVYFIGHGVDRDVATIYTTLDMEPEILYPFINTANSQWCKVWDSLRSPDIPTGTGRYGLGALMETTILTNAKMDRITKCLYGPGEYKIHTSMFDTALLFILVTMLLAKRHSELTYLRFCNLLLDDTSVLPFSSIDN